jgi:hypothetical protein
MKTTTKKQDWSLAIDINGYELSDLACKLISAINWCREKNKTPYQYYTEINSFFFKKFFNNNYTKGLKELVECGIVEINASEGLGLGKSGAAYSVGSFSKGYRFNSSVERKLDLKQFSLRKIAIPAIRNVKATWRPIEDELLNRYQDFYQDINITNWRDMWVDDPYETGYTGTYLHDRSIIQSIQTGDITLKYGEKSMRLYHPLILARKELRKYFQYNGENISLIDIKTCHPKLLANFTTTTEAKKWLTICSTDLYSRFVTDDVDRDLVKERFQQAVSKIEGVKAGVVFKIRQFIKQEAPGIYKWLESVWESETSVQCILQNLEASIVLPIIEELSNDTFCLPAHDGIFYCDLRKTELIQDKLKLQCEKILGFNLITDVTTYN